MHWVWLALPILALQTPERALAAPRLPPLLLTQLDERQPLPDLDNRTFTISFAHPAPIREVLLTIVRGTSLSILPDPGLTGTFIGELKHVTVRRALDMVLPPFGLDYIVDDGVVRVFKRPPETRLFELNYAAAPRRLSANADVFADIAATIKTLLSEQASYSVDRKAGLLQVTDTPERLDRVTTYLDAVRDRVLREVEIDARVIEVERPGHADPAMTAPLPSRVVDLTRFLSVLASMGTVRTLATPRIVTLNNEPALVRAERAVGGGRAAVTISVTPQIADDGAITLSLSPIVKVSAGATAESGAASALSEADTLARVADGETLVVGGGVSRDEDGNVTKKRTELLVLLTPRVVRTPAAGRGR